MAAFLRQIKNIDKKYLCKIRKLSYYVYDDVDPAPLFFNSSVQQILKGITGFDVNRIFRERHYESDLEKPEYQFLTEEELKIKIENVKVKAEELLQMPPIVKVRNTNLEILSNDYRLQSFDDDDSKYIFTDITYGLSDAERLIVTREPNGILRIASGEERDRMNSIYNPSPHKKVNMPKVFLEGNLQGVIDREKYEFVLDWACLQFEPDNLDYQRVTSTIYEAVNSKGHYDKLCSTRHFGPMCFYLAWHKKIDDLLIYLMQNERLSDSYDIIKLLYIIYPDLKPSQGETNVKEDFILSYITENATKVVDLKMGLQVCLDKIKNKEEYRKQVTQAHGL